MWIRIRIRILIRVFCSVFIFIFHNFHSLLLFQGVLQFGMVIENAEFVSSDESSGSEDEEQVKMGTVRVAWYPAGTEEVLYFFILWRVALYEVHPKSN